MLPWAREKVDITSTMRYSNQSRAYADFMRYSMRELVREVTDYNLVQSLRYGSGNKARRRANGLRKGINCITTR